MFFDSTLHILRNVATPLAGGRERSVAVAECASEGYESHVESYSYDVGSPSTALVSGCKL